MDRCVGENMRMAENRTNIDQFQLRLPPGLRERIKEKADANGRSMNTEIVEAIEAALVGGEQVNELKKHLVEENKAYLRMEAMFDSQMTLIEDYRRIIKAATRQSLQLAGIVENLSSILLSIDAAPDQEVLDLAQRLLDQAVAAKADLTTDADMQTKKYGAD
jgi:molecular chaperone GrpE (heat shock protein)